MEPKVGTNRPRSGLMVAAAVIAVTVAAMTAFFSTPRGKYVWAFTIMHPIHRQIFYYQKDRAIRAWMDQCVHYEQNPSYYLKRGEINQRQYDYIVRHHYMSSPDVIAALGDKSRNGK